MVRQAHSGARGVKAVLDELVRLQAARDRVDDLALALDDGERGALGVVRDEVLGDAARVRSLCVQRDPLWRTRPNKLTHSQGGGAGGFVNGARRGALRRGAPRPTRRRPYVS